MKLSRFLCETHRLLSRRSYCSEQLSFFRHHSNHRYFSSDSLHGKTPRWQASPPQRLFPSTIGNPSANFSESTSESELREGLDLLECSGDDTRTVAESDFVVLPDFVTEQEEASLLKEVERFLKKTRYEYDHWDNAIHGFRETEKSKWSQENGTVIQRIRDAAFPSSSAQLSLVHVLDLASNGYIKPHVDSVKFCGSTIAGLCLISPAIMRLVHTEDKSRWVNVLLNPRSLYIMRDKIRYDYTHEVLKDEESIFKGNRIPRDRRISVMCRNSVTGAPS